MALFLRALGSGYLLIAVTAAYALISIPLALHYLGQAQFGLWALAVQVTAYYALIDLGMTTSVCRHLIEQTTIMLRLRDKRVVCFSVSTHKTSRSKSMIGDQ